MSPNRHSGIPGDSDMKSTPTHLMRRKPHCPVQSTAGTTPKRRSHAPYNIPRYPPYILRKFRQKRWVKHWFYVTSVKTKMCLRTTVQGGIHRHGKSHERSDRAASTRHIYRRSRTNVQWQAGSRRESHF